MLNTPHDEEHHTEVNIRNGSCLPGTGGRSGAAVNHYPDDGSGEIGDGAPTRIGVDEDVLWGRTPCLHLYQPTPLGQPQDRSGTDSVRASIDALHTPHVEQMERNIDTDSGLGTTEEDVPIRRSQRIRDRNQHCTYGIDLCGEGCDAAEDDRANQDTRENAQRRKKKKKGKNTKGWLRVTSLNMKGRGAPSAWSPRSKWAQVNEMLKKEKIGMLTLQETHLSDAYVEEIHQKYSRRMKVFHSIDPEHPNAKGVAVVLNRELINIDNVESLEVIAGRALLVTIPWHGDLTLTWLVIYAPNDTAENRQFWTDMSDKWSTLDLPSPDGMSGDFNFGEDEIDRCPCRKEDAGLLQAFREFKNTLKLRDGWRNENPDMTNYTFFQPAPPFSASRIDRIYVSPELAEYSEDWKIELPNVNTDHRMVSVKISSPRLPYIGRGRWTMRPHLLKNEKMLKEIDNVMLVVQAGVEDSAGNQRTEDNNPQTVYAKGKERLRTIIQKYAKVSVPQKQARLNEMKVKLDFLLTDEDTALEERLAGGAILQDEIFRLQQELNNENRVSTAIKARMEVETVSKFWMNMGKKKSPRETIQKLKRPSSTGDRGINAERSDEMADVARSFYENLQTDDAYPDITSQQRQELIDEVVRHITTEVPVDQRQELVELLSDEEIMAALKSAALGKAAGVDGLIYELWKTLHLRFLTREDQDQRADIIRIFRIVFNDIETHGIVPGTGFSMGWICPLYKKKDRTDIANYRPITLLNTDYKVMTKALAVKLARVAPTVIHEAQAGFVPGRSIFDQIDLAREMICLAEAEERNGVIVALDQEKAYDRISHDYLWCVMDKLKIPEQFTNTVRSLYTDAKSVVIVNGETSREFSVTRGVRQGDPLSCLLFDLAIEPLAQMLRDSPLEGFQLPNIRERIITMLFADDTTVYLSEHDDYEVLQKILDKWCIASGAKFNIAKTSVIPVGAKSYRQLVLQRRSNRAVGSPFPDKVRFAEEGEATRILGAFLGNEVDEAAPWVPILEKISDSLEFWATTYPTVEGRALLTKIFVGGYTQFLTRAQGMPETVELHLVKLIRDFCWDGEGRTPISMDMMVSGINEGGKRVLDIVARNEAIQVMRLKSYLRLDDKRPLAAFVTDLLINKAIRDPRARPNIPANTFLQTFKVNSNRNSKLPRHTARMLKTAKDLGVRFEMAAPCAEILGKIPVWHHFGLKEGIRRMNSTDRNRCLQTNHGVEYVSDVVEIVNRQENERHEENDHCRCEGCCFDREVLHCEKPGSCVVAAARLLDRLSPRWDPRKAGQDDGLGLSEKEREHNVEARESGGRIVFDPTIDDSSSLADGFRIFTKGTTQSRIPAKRYCLGVQLAAEPEDVAYTDGSAIRNGAEDACAGSGVWYSNNDPRNVALRVKGVKQTNNTGEVRAVLQRATAVSPYVAMLTRSDSTYTIDGLCFHLRAWEDRGWIGVPNRTFFQATAAKLRRHGNVVTFQWVKGHSGEVGNEEADKLAAIGASMEDDGLPDPELEIEEQFKINGAKLATMTQAMAYRGIKERQGKCERDATEQNLDRIRASVTEVNGTAPSDAAIWRGMRNKDISRSARSFIWKATHKAYRLGNAWAGFGPEYASRVLCPECGDTETMDHILLECEIPGRRNVWMLAEDMWRKKGYTWPSMSLGLILGCALYDPRDDEDGRLPGAARLFRIIVSESAHLIWKLRCERRIANGDDPDKWPSNDEIIGRWLYTINERLTLDRLATNPRRYGKKAIKKKIVLQTWSGTLDNEDALPRDWTMEPTGVLVGSDWIKRRPRGRHRVPH
ncbi:uncharacterized protein ARMOST_09585 [Armillaria ostoyae]|uniref:Reverse transcriptase n=1 Tax=Armillaria ostoyae TaxID=47428 RepID=A0A284RBX1_ARMOS|nr:uncharacterized protein ARMOST_09585 [Armillaria ostoyae]